VRREVDQEELAGEIRREVADAIGELAPASASCTSRPATSAEPHVPHHAVAALKVAYAGRVKAEAKAAEAQQVADAESLKRQLAKPGGGDAAQVEPHFLFNTLASIDH